MKSERKGNYLWLYIINRKHQTTEEKKIAIVEYKMALENTGTQVLEQPSKRKIVEVRKK